MKYKCTILRTTHTRNDNDYTQPFRRVEVDRLRSLFNYVRKLNRRYVKKRIRYTVEIETQ